MNRAVDRIEMHQRQLAWRIRSLLYMGIDRLIGQRLYKIALPVPLQPLWKEWVKKALHGRKGHSTHPIENWLRNSVEERCHGFCALLNWPLCSGPSCKDDRCNAGGPITGC